MSEPHDSEQPPIVHTVPEDTSPQRLDRYLACQDSLKLSRSRIQRLIEDNCITVNGNAVDKKYLVHPGDSVEIILPEPQPATLVAEDIPVNIVYQDQHLLVVNKPAGMVTHPAVGNTSGTLVNALLYHFKQLPGPEANLRPGIVHRLDKNTSGLLVVACNEIAFAALQEAIKQRTVKRTYLALVCGHLKEQSGSLNYPVGRSPRDRKKMAVVASGRPAVTHYRSLARYKLFDYLEISLETGRTHQIRVHFSHIGHPVFGDPEYGGRESWQRGIFALERPFARQLLALVSRQALHACRLELVHPITKENLSIEAPLPDDLQAVLNLLEAEGR